MQPHSPAQLVGCHLATRWYVISRMHQHEPVHHTCAAVGCTGVAQQGELWPHTYEAIGSLVAHLWWQAGHTHMQF
jgi:hypothetical protein